jgi:hypothetical protein
MKDPAALMYIDTWLTSTAEMDADCRGWYLNLILHQYDKKSLPNDIEKLAVLASVKFSEFQRFKQVFEQMLKQKFDIGEDGRLRNKKADEVLQSRKKFTDKRSKSGSVGFVVKLAMTIGYKPNEIELLKTDLYLEKVDIEQAKDKQMLKQMLKLYRNVDEDVNRDSNTLNKKGVVLKDRIPSVESFINYGLEQAAKNRLNVTETAISMKYEAWKENGWVNGNGQEIRNWKSSLLNTLKHIQETEKGKPIKPETKEDEEARLFMEAIKDYNTHKELYGEDSANEKFKFNEHIQPNLNNNRLA